jgi:hypothetical protein
VSSSTNRGRRKARSLPSRRSSRRCRLSPTASAESKTATLGDVTAVLSWTPDQYGVKDAKLTITRAGAVGFNRAIPKVIPDGSIILSQKDNPDDVRVLDLDGDGEPEVVVSGFSGGAHCCFVGGFYDLRGTSYAETTEFFGSYGFELRDIGKDGTLEIDAADVRFEDIYSSHAASFPPVRILRFSKAGGTAHLVDVTRRHPSKIRANAKTAKSLFKEFMRSDGLTQARGVVATYVADQYLLGRGKVGLRELDRQAARGVLGRTAKQVRSWRRNLLGVLHEYGYR